jgi:glycosyl hydrolase family 100 (putative invertase)
MSDKALALLHALTGPHGIRASLSTTANYDAIFTRDAAMAGIAGLLAGDETIATGLVHTVTCLRDLQGPEGQIASNFLMRAEARPRVSFGTLAPRIDSTGWYLIGIALAARAGVLDPGPFHQSARLVVRLLDALEYNGRHLIYVPAGGNWADEYIYDGYILYDQVLRAWALRLSSETFGEPAWADKAAQIELAIEDRYWPRGEEDRRYPLAAFSPTVIRDVFDLAACSLLAVSGTARRLTGMALDWIDERFLSRAELPPAFHPAIDETHPDWPALRRYHLHEFRNRPHEYHNGGIWPIWLGWLALGLARTDRPSSLSRLRALVDERIRRLETFAFDEYLHGATGTPGGVAQMAYSATGLVFLDVAGSEAQTRLFGA